MKGSHTLIALGTKTINFLMTFVIHRISYVHKYFSVNGTIQKKHRAQKRITHEKGAYL